MIPVVFCFDAKFAQPAAVGIASVYSNASSAVRFYCLVPNEDIGNIKVIDGLKEKLDLTVIPVDKNVFAGWKTGHLSLAAYLRLLIPDHVPEKRAIYLDSDTLTLGDLSELFSLDLGTNLIGAMGGKGEPGDTRVPRSPEDNYVNSGVLLMDLDVLRADNFLQKCRDIYRTYQPQIIWHDQCVLNKYAECRKLLIDPKWNYKIWPGIAKNHWDTAVSSAKILHFTMGAKPWLWAPQHVKTLWGIYESKLLELRST